MKFRVTGCLMSFSLANHVQATGLQKNKKILITICWLSKAWKEGEYLYLRVEIKDP